VDTIIEPLFRQTAIANVEINARRPTAKGYPKVG
jgi:hypothetical protein